jgi:hypothetical protein
MFNGERIVLEPAWCGHESRSAGGFGTDAGARRFSTLPPLGRLRFDYVSTRLVSTTKQKPLSASRFQGLVALMDQERAMILQREEDYKASKRQKQGKAAKGMREKRNHHHHHTQAAHAHDTRMRPPPCAQAMLAAPFPFTHTRTRASQGRSRRWCGTLVGSLRSRQFCSNRESTTETF